MTGKPGYYLIACVINLLIIAPKKLRYPRFTTKKEYFEYMGTVDSNILTVQEISENEVSDVRAKTLNEWATKQGIPAVAQLLDESVASPAGLENAVYRALSVLGFETHN